MPTPRVPRVHAAAAPPLPCIHCRPCLVCSAATLLDAFTVAVGCRGHACLLFLLKRHHRPSTISVASDSFVAYVLSVPPYLVVGIIIAITVAIAIVINRLAGDGRQGHDPRGQHRGQVRGRHRSSHVKGKKTIRLFLLSCPRKGMGRSIPADVVARCSVLWPPSESCVTPVRVCVCVL